MREKDFWFILWFIINIILTPFLIVATAFSGIIFIWGFWFFVLYIKNSELSRFQKYLEKEKIKKNKKEEEERPIKNAIIKKRIENGCFTNESFKKYMNSRGFIVNGDIDIFSNIIQHIIVETHMSKKQLEENGIHSVRQILGDYNWWFDFYDIWNGSAFTYKKDEQNDNNIIIHAWYIPWRDKNIKIYNDDFIYCIEKEKEFVPCKEIVNNKWVTNKKKVVDLAENDLSRIKNDGAYIYKYKIYKWKSGMIEKINNSSLTKNERNFIEIAKRERKKRRNIAHSYVDTCNTKSDSYSNFYSALQGCGCWKNAILSHEVFFLLNNNPVILT